MAALIPLADCEDRRLYRVRSRNLTMGAFRAETRGFIGLRYKFGSLYLFQEYHHDVGRPYGTVHPIEVMAERVSDDLLLAEHLPGSTCSEHGLACEYREDVPGATPRRGTWHHLNDGTPLDAEDLPCARPNWELTFLMATHTDLADYPDQARSELERLRRRDQWRIGHGTPE